MYLPHVGLVRIPAIGWAAWVLASAPGLVAAQVPDLGSDPQSRTPSTQSPAGGGVAARSGSDQLEPRASGQWFEPRISVQHTVTNNSRLIHNGSGDQITEVMPGFRLARDTARLKGFVDYTLRAVNYARDTSPDKIWHNLYARGTVEAVEDHVFVDVDGRAALQPISAFGPAGGANTANTNLTQATSFSVSPYIKGDLTDGLSYEARYRMTDTRYDTAARSNVMVHDWLLQLEKRPLGQLMSWTVEAAQQNAEYTNGRNIDTTALRGRLGYMPRSGLRLVAIGGAESTNQLSPIRETSSILGFGVDWRPSERTSVSFERVKRYFGESHNAVAQYRTGRTVWRYTDKKSVVNGLGDQFGSPSPLYDLLDGFYMRTEPNAIRRMQLVQAEIERMGLPADMQVFQDFLTSSSKLQRLQNLSFAIFGQRSTLTVAVMRSDSRLLQGAFSLGDDFSNDSKIRQRGWNISASHRLTPSSGVTLSFGEMRNSGVDTGLETRTRPFIFSWTSLVARRTSVGLQLRRVLSDGNVSQYGESAIMGFITHRF